MPSRAADSRRMFHVKHFLAGDAPEMSRKSRFLGAWFAERGGLGRPVQDRAEQRED